MRVLSIRRINGKDAWREARRAAVISVLGAIENSQWSGNLVLRGSVLLKAWLRGGGALARGPGLRRDPPELEDRGLPDAADARRHRRRRTASVRRRTGHHRRRPAIEGIWTYDRVPGLRMMLPWTADGGRSGDLQLDFVFNEHLPVAPELTEVSLSSDGPKALACAAPPELSLAWKVQWLITDMYPQAKDLYDAVLLAERTHLRYDLLRQLVTTADPVFERLGVTLAAISGLDCVDFRAFHADYPDLSADGQDLVQRLAAALEPTFASAPPPLRARRSTLIRPPGATGTRSEQRSTATALAIPISCRSSDCVPGGGNERLNSVTGCPRRWASCAA